MQLPAEFVQTMKHLLGPEWSDFHASLMAEPKRGVRLHRGTATDISVDKPLSVTSPWALQAPIPPVPPEVRGALGPTIPWSAHGYAIAPDSLLGRHVHHHMGLYYIQEPSAMAAVTALAPQPGERILDLCAAPGGKSTAIAREMCGQGLLVTNEPHPARAVTLAQNLERLGVHAPVFHEQPDRLAEAFGERFDGILVDAPCSGEGMFRKDPDAATAWHPDAPAACADRQRDILTSALAMLKPGGRLVYSTCTFNAQENEQVVEWAVHTFGLTVDPLPNWQGWSTARSEWTRHRTDVSGARRLWPHIGSGEGHFVCRLTKPLDAHVAADVVRSAERRAKAERNRRDGTGEANGSNKSWEPLLRSLLAHSWPPEGASPLSQSNTLFYPPAEPLPMAGLKLLRVGVCLASYNHAHWEPHHHLAMSLAADAAAQPVAISLAQAQRYMAGEALALEAPRGWVWLHCDGFPVGWGKAVTGRINNAYPKGLRKMGLLVSHLPSTSDHPGID